MRTGIDVNIGSSEVNLGRDDPFPPKTVSGIARGDGVLNHEKMGIRQTEREEKGPGIQTL